MLVPINPEVEIFYRHSVAEKRAREAKTLLIARRRAARAKSQPPLSAVGGELKFA
ncbi:hypothetical protein KCP78_18490 [Salmonella enterica subsp. enterica]|nr:hypothetical protein KCP78_18490 [Salmonella enterica subsp. enterica]